MQVINFIVITSAVLCLSSAKTNIGADGSLTYECTSTTVIITGKNATYYGSIFASGTNGTNKNSECSVSRTSPNQSARFEISGCIVTKPITVIIMQEKQDLNQPNMVLGGQLTTEYELQCNDVYLGGVTMNKTFNLSKVDDMRVDTRPHQPTFILSMTMQTVDHKTLNDTVLIGTDLLLIITGTYGFRMYPESCVASNLPNLTGHVKHLITNGVADDPMIMTKFTDQTNYTKDIDIIEAHLYAFHFLNSNAIYLECTVSVCKNDDNSCHALSSSTTKTPVSSTTQITTHATGITSSSSTAVTTKTATTVTTAPKASSATGRRKRNVGNTVPHKHTVRTTLRVVDNNIFSENTPVYSSAFRVSSFWTTSTLICIALQVARP